MNRFFSTSLRGIALAAVLSAGLNAPARAVATVNFHGTLQVGSCSADTVDVDFGEITVADAAATTTTDTTAAAAAMPGTIRITCTGGIAGTVQVALNGTPAAFNSLALKTNMPDLGVQVSSAISGKNGGVGVMTPGAWYTVPGSSGDYTLAVILVRNPGATLKGGDFLATGTIAVQIA